MLSVNRVGLALGALALTACAETQAPDSPNAPRGDASIASRLPVLETARTDHASAQTSGPFNVTLRFVTSSSGKQKQVFRSAARRWQEIIVKDVPSTTGTIPANFCGDLGTPEFSGTIDDILIDVLLTPIDGPGNILGATGVCALRLQDDLPVYGVMFFDTEDLDFIHSFGLLDEVITHEMGTHSASAGSGISPVLFSRTWVRETPDSPAPPRSRPGTNWEVGDRCRSKGNSAREPRSRIGTRIPSVTSS